jgi:hypothetical protein
VRWGAVERSMSAISRPRRCPLRHARCGRLVRPHSGCAGPWTSATGREDPRRSAARRDPLRRTEAPAAATRAPPRRSPTSTSGTPCRCGRRRTPARTRAGGTLRAHRAGAGRHDHGLRRARDGERPRCGRPEGEAGPGLAARRSTPGRAGAAPSAALARTGPAEPLVAVVPAPSAPAGCAGTAAIKGATARVVVQGPASMSFETRAPLLSTVKMSTERGSTTWTWADRVEARSRSRRGGVGPGGGVLACRRRRRVGIATRQDTADGHGGRRLDRRGPRSPRVGNGTGARAPGGRPRTARRRSGSRRPPAVRRAPGAASRPVRVSPQSRSTGGRGRAPPP